MSLAMKTEPDAQHDLLLAIETSGRLGSVALGRGGGLLEERPFSVALSHARELLPTIRELCRDHAAAPAQITCVCVSAGPGSFTGLRVGVTCARMLALATGAATVAVPTLDVIAQNALRAARPPRHVAVLLDAKRKRVFAAAFRLDGAGAGDSGASAPGEVQAARSADPAPSCSDPAVGSVEAAGASAREARYGAIDGSARYVAITEAAERDPAAFLAECSADTAVMGEGVAYHREAVDDSGLRTLPEELSRPAAGVVLSLGRARWLAGGATPSRELVPIYVRRPEAEEVWERRQAGR